MKKKYYEVKGQVSNSSLNVLERSVREFKKFIYEDVEEKSTSYFDFGTALHMYILEPKRFEKEIKVLDYTLPKSQQQKEFCKAYAKLKKVTDKNLKGIFLNSYKDTAKWKEKATQIVKENSDYIEYLKYSKNKLVISSETMRKIESISNELKVHKMASKLLQEASPVDTDILDFNELEIYWEYKGIKCKSMLDRVVVDTHEKIVYIIDLKTTASLVNFKTSFEKYRYDRQLAFYGMAFTHSHENLDLKDYKIIGVIIAVDKNTAEVKTFKISEEVLNKALDEIVTLLERAKWHIDNNKFDYSREYYEGEGFETL